MSVLQIINFYLLPGVVIGATYALAAIGITLVYAIMRHGHIAHGDLAAFGAYAALGFVTGFGLPIYVALPLAMVLCGLVAVGIDELFYSPLRTQPKLITTIASLGAALMLRSIIQIYWGVQTQTYFSGITRPHDWFGLRIKFHETVTVLIALGLIVALQLFLTRTKWGKAMRAMSNNPDLASLSGVDNRKVNALTWLIAGALCAAAGFFLGLNTELKPLMGWNILLPSFAAAVLGGIGKVEGAVMGGLIIGIVEEMSVLVIPTEYKATSSFFILLVVLLLRPRGIFNGKLI